MRPVASLTTVGRLQSNRFILSDLGENVNQDREFQFGSKSLTGKVFLHLGRLLTCRNRQDRRNWIFGVLPFRQQPGQKLFFQP